MEANIYVLRVPILVDAYLYAVIVKFISGAQNTTYIYFTEMPSFCNKMKLEGSVWRECQGAKQVFTINNRAKIYLKH